jgi:DNA polymerase III subunit delta
MSPMAELKPVYLVCGDDDAKIDSWRTRVRRRAEEELGPGGLEVFDAKADGAEAVVAALATLTFATGTRYLLAEDVAAWKAPELAPLTDAIGALPPDLVLVLILRGKPPKGLVKAVEAAGGVAHIYEAPKPWELPKWAIARARELGLRLEPDAAKLLVGIVGTGQQRLAREIEKLAIAVYPEVTARAEHVEQFAAGETAPKIYDLADALVAGDREATLQLAEELVANEERPSRFVYPVVGRLREVHRALELLEAGTGEKDLAKEMKLPPWRLKKVVPLARRADKETLERALCRFADLELELRGGGTLDEETAVSLALAST